MVGGTLENKDRLRGGAWTWTSAVLIAQALVSFLSVAPPDDPGTFSLSPSENDSKFSPTNEGVFEQTEEPEKKIKEVSIKTQLLWSFYVVKIVLQFGPNHCIQN